MNFQIVNIKSPNSKINTCIFCAFLASDSVTNLHVGLDRYADQISKLQTMNWKYVNLLLIMKYILHTSY